MLKKENRLQGKRGVGKVLSKGFAVRSEHFTCRFLRARSGPTRLTVVVSKKISNLATVRNKLKRRVREVFAGEIGRTSGILIVVFPNRLAIETAFEKLQKEARICIEKAPSS